MKIKAVANQNKLNLRKLTGIAITVFFISATAYGYKEYRYITTYNLPKAKTLTIDRLDLGTLPDTNKSRAFIAKQLGRRLKNNLKADKVGVFWKYDTGSRVELGYDRDKGYLYAQADGAFGACGIGENFVLQQIQTMNEKNVSGFENPSFWEAGCAETVMVR